jgi:hypothetical protein
VSVEHAEGDDTEERSRYAQREEGQETPLEEADSEVHRAQRIGYLGYRKRRHECGERASDQSERIARDVRRYGELEQDNPHESAAEAKESLPGDNLPGETSSTRAITIAAPAMEVWRWLVQIRLDRAGLYSYTAIENGLFRAGIHNTDRIVPEWQKLNRGDFVPATRPDWMGGRFADRAGWKVADIEAGRYLVLENWGTFLVRPIDANHCRLIVRSHGKRPPLWLAPLNFLVLEPGHFIMERKMMLGIKAARRGGRRTSE